MSIFNILNNDSFVQPTGFVGCTHLLWSTQFNGCNL